MLPKKAIIVITDKQPNVLLCASEDAARKQLQTMYCQEIERTKKEKNLLSYVHSFNPNGLSYIRKILRTSDNPAQTREITYQLSNIKKL